MPVTTMELDREKLIATMIAKMSAIDEDLNDLHDMPVRMKELEVKTASLEKRMARVEQALLKLLWIGVSSLISILGAAALIIFKG